MTLIVWWQRHRWTLVFGMLAVLVGGGSGALVDVLLSLPTRHDSRASFYVELFFAGIGALLLVSLLLTRARAGLPLLLAVLAFLPSRTGMQWRYFGYAIISVADLVVLLGFLVLVLRTKIVRKERWQRVVVRTPLWLWCGVGALGTLVAIARGVPWLNYLPMIKGYYLWILIVVLCVNVVRTRLTLRLLMICTVVSALPNVLFQIRDTLSGTGGMAGYLSNGTIVTRTAGGAGLINPYAFYIMIAFFLSIGLGLTSHRLLPRLFFFACAVYFLVGIGMTYTRGAWIATAVGLLVLAIAGGWRLRAGLLVTATVGYFLVPAAVWARLNFSDNSVGERVGYATTALAAIRAYPWFGGGWGSNFYLVGKFVASDFTPGNLPWWHDDYLIVATQVGLPGLATFLAVWAALFWAGVRAYRRAPAGDLRTYLLVFLVCIAAMSTQAFTDMFFWRNDTGPLIWLVVGLMCVAINMVAEDARAATPVPITGAAGVSVPDAALPGRVSGAA